MDALKTAVLEYLQKDDSQLLLVALSQHISSGRAEDVASLLLLPEHRTVVKRLGWDLLLLLTPHLPPLITPSPVWQLVTAIAETCSAKEMCLAFLEQLELASTASSSLFFHLLKPLHTVLVRLGIGEEKRHVSSLRSVRGMVDRVYPSLEGRGRGGEGEEGVTPPAAAGCVVELVDPFVTYIHHQFTSNEALLQTFWTPLQTECAGLLLTLLGDPLVSCDLGQESMDTDSRTAVEAVMSGVVRCHCGCLQLLEWEGDGSVQRPALQEEDDDTSPFGVPAVGVACFAYLLLVENVHSSYLPSPVHPHHLLHTSLTHTLTLLHRQERHSMRKGLFLLECVVHRVASHSLPAHCLTSHRYLNTAQCLVDIMVTCPHKQLRQKCVSLLPDFISRFPAPLRHKLYRSLLRGTAHAGVQGMLIHSIKNEVDQALRENDVSSPFLGSELITVLREILSFSPDMELLRETDRVMTGLNFLRYLLIRDKAVGSRVHTGVWEEVERVRSTFLEPVRWSLEAGQLQCRGEMARLGREGVRVEDVPKVSVEVIGEELPDISADEQMKMLQLAQYQLDMIECVLVRVEEILDDRPSP